MKPGTTRYRSSLFRVQCLNLVESLLTCFNGNTAKLRAQSNVVMVAIIYSRSCLIGKLVVWLVDWWVGWLVGRLVDWLVDWCVHFAEWLVLPYGWLGDLMECSTRIKEHTLTNLKL